VAVEVNAKGFDFFGVAPGRGFDGFGAGVFEDAEGDGDGVALLLIALEEELHIALPQAHIGNFDAGIVLLFFAEDANGGGAVGEFGGIGFGGVEVLEEFEDFTGGEGGGGGGEADNARLVDIVDEGAKVLIGAGVLFATEPALVAAVAPMGEVLALNGLAIELGGEDGFDGWKVVKPSQDIPLALAIEEALIELLAEVVREAGDFANEGAVGAIIDRVWFGHGGEEVWVGHN
jgi:hypothetical protein